MQAYNLARSYSMSPVGAKRWLSGCLAACLVPVSVVAQSSKAPIGPVELFRHVSARLMDDWRRMPNYTCLQNISRSYYRSDLKSAPSCKTVLEKSAARKHALPLEVVDRLELEVAVANRREVHSWPGESFIANEDEIHNLVGNGAFGSGDFAAFIGAIFGGSAKVTYEDELIVDGRSLYHYSFQVSKEASRYEVDAKPSRVVTGYGGSFLLDPETEDLAHLSVHTTELPEATGSCQANNEIEYGRTEIHGMQVLLPRETDLRVILRRGDEAITTTSYSSCRQFSTKSKLLLDPTAVGKPAGGQEMASTQREESAFPPGIKFKCRIVTPLSSDTPAGRQVEGVLRTPIQDRDGTILAPRGAKVKARIVRLSQRAAIYDFFELAVRLESVEVGGVERPLRASLVDQMTGPVAPKVRYPGALPDQIALGNGLLDNTGEFFFVQEHLQLKYLDAQWVTRSAAPKKEIKNESQVARDQIPPNPATDAAALAPAEKASSETKVESTPPESPADAFALAEADQSETSKLPGSQTEVQQDPDFRLKVQSNLVLVRVVARDGKGNPIQGLEKDDFQLLDRGKRQEIAQFEVVNSADTLAPAAKSAGDSTTAAAAAGHPSFLVLYFDDLNISDADLMQALDAAQQYLAKHRAGNQKVAVITSSASLTDLTDDPKKIQDALAKLHASPRALSHTHDCPELSDFQAQQIVQFQYDYEIDAWKAALDEVKARCPLPAPRSAMPQSQSPIYSMITMQARQVLAQAEILARTNLQQLEQVVSYLAQFPGQRTIVLVSPGFLSESEQAQLDRIIDHALRSQVVVSSLDPKGLALLMRDVDITRSYVPTANSGAIGATRNVDFMREAAATDVLMEVAEGTGGKFFHNDNDLEAGFAAVSGSPVYYILAFVPKDFDGTFHKLEVKLTRTKGSVQARRGYFAVQNPPAVIGAQKEQKTELTDDLRSMMSSREEVHDLPIDLSIDVIASSAETRDVTVFVKLDLASVPFHKEGDRNVNTVTFVAGVYDGEGKWVDGERKRFDLKLPDTELNDMQARGVVVRNTFKLKPGKYLCREVVQDTDDHRIAAVNRSFEVR